MGAIRIGGIIAAARKKPWKEQTQSLLQIGDISAIKRIVLTFQCAGVSPILVITGDNAYEVERELASYEVIFLNIEDYEEKQLFHIAQAGMTYLQGKCGRMFFTPVSIPLFTPGTLKEMMNCSNNIVSPSYNMNSGHPVLISSILVPKILEYRGNDGLRGALAELGEERTWVTVNDEGILRDVESIEQNASMVQDHSDTIFHPYLQLSLEKEKSFFNSRTKILLTLIEETHSVQTACSYMALSYSKAWVMLNNLEKELGYKVVNRKQGGKRGGKTTLTQEGILFLKKYELLETEVRSFAKKRFDELFWQENKKE